MKTYIVYDPTGEERGYFRVNKMVLAERFAIESFGEGSAVEYTELGPEFDGATKFFTNDWPNRNK